MKKLIVTVFALAIAASAWAIDQSTREGLYWALQRIERAINEVDSGRPLPTRESVLQEASASAATHRDFVSDEITFIKAVDMEFTSMSRDIEIAARFLIRQRRESIP